MSEEKAIEQSEIPKEEEKKEEIVKEEKKEESEEEEEKEKEEPTTEKFELEFPMEGDLNANGTLIRTTTKKGESKEYSITVEINLTKDEKVELDCTSRTILS